jgi:hypothetical protein
LISKSGTAGSKMREYQRRFGDKTMRPYHLPGDVITPAVYEQAERFLVDGRWSPETVRQRLQSLLTTVSSLLEFRPRLSDSLGQILDRAEQEKTALLEVLTAPGVSQTQAPKTAKPPAEQTSRRVNPPTSVNKPMANPKPTSKDDGRVIDQQRLDELYKLIIAIAGALTCKPRTFASGTIRSFLGVALHLGRCTLEEAGRYGPLLMERSKRNGERDVHDGSETIIEQWRKTKCRWLQFQLKNRWCLKLAARHGREAASLLHDFGLTEAGVQAARLARREARQAAWKSRLANKQARKT